MLERRSFCFLCRQGLVEFFDLDCSVTLYNRNGDEKVLKVSDLCPYPFSSGDLR